MGRSSKEIDWESVERDYRLGLLTLNQIADKHKVSQPSISRRANKYKWSRDLSAQVRAGLNAKMIASNALEHEVVNTHVETHVSRMHKDAISVEASVNKSFEIVQSHQVGAENQKSIMNALMTELREQVAEGRKTIAELTQAVLASDPNAYKDLYRVLSLPSRIDSLKKLTELHNNIIAAERKAFNIDAEEKKSDTTIDEMIKMAAAQDDFDKY